MKKLLIACVLSCAFLNQAFAEQLNIRFVNFKSCVEKSKLGMQEQESFDVLKKQMETVLEEKEKKLNEMMGKLDDGDYLDSISPEAETELKRKFRALSQELTQQQNQYFQTLQQANFRIVQKLTDVVNEAADKVAKQDKIDLILNEEGTFFYSPKLDISEQVVKIMDLDFKKEEAKG